MGQPDTTAPRKLSWTTIPLYLRIIAALVLGLIVGLIAGHHAAVLANPSKLLLRILGALAAPVIFLAILQALMHAQLPKGTGLRLATLLGTNTVMAILLGLFVSNTLQPGRWKEIPYTPPNPDAKPAGTDLVGQIFDQVPKSVLGPFGDEGKILSIIFIALAFGIALRGFKETRIATVADIVETAFKVLIVILHWVIETVPFAVFGVVASIIGKDGFAAFQNLFAFVIAVIVALLLQVGYYCLRIRFSSWVNPLKMLSQMKDALLMAFSTSSSTITMPLTYALLRDKVGLRERSASLGALVGSNFNNDGTALYEAMAALFISQLLGQHLTLTQQGLVVLTSVIASVGAAGIPEAGLVTMTLVFTAVDLPVGYIPLLLTTDWFLDRCRTTVNVLGDVTVACVLDGKTKDNPTSTPSAPLPLPSTNQ